ncbi:MAG TPA: NFACT family protein [Thermodesulfobacteriota bacterium]|nr:NFACT family protein [Thermodesulfobacteriota bacterium]
MSPELLSHIVKELPEAIKGGVISKIRQSDEKTIFIEVFLRGQRKILVISAHHTHPRLHLTSEKHPNPVPLLHFCAFLRSRIEGAKIEDVSQVSGENIARIELAKRDGEETKCFTLLAELTGKSSNIILLDSDGIVLEAIKRFPLDTSSRPVAPGVKLAPLSRPLAVKEKIPPFSPTGGETWNEAAERYYGSVLLDESMDARQRRLHRVISEAVKKSKRKLENLLSDKKKAEADEHAFRLGELLLLNFTKIQKGAKEIAVENIYDDPPVTIVIPLDPKSSPKENAARFFKRSKKARTALSLLDKRLPEVRGEVECLEGFLYECENMETMDDALMLEDELASMGYIKMETLKKEAKKPTAEPLRRFTSSEGFEILCGKSGNGNDLLVREYLKKDDLWFHAKDSPGAHVVLKSGGKRLTEKAIQEAAAVAAYFSKFKDAEKAEVVFAEAGEVKKPRGAKPGLVTVARYKTVLIKPKLLI